MIFIEEPKVCPTCSHRLIKQVDQLFCRNTACSAQVLKKIEHFAKVLSIKGLGPKTIEKLDIQEVTELFSLDRNDVVLILGEKVADKILLEIEKAKDAGLATVIEAFSIPLVGSTASIKISKVITKIDDITEELCKKAGLGAKVTENLLLWLETDYKELKEFLPFTYKNALKPSIKGETVCITGKLKNFKKKADAEELLAAAGYVLVDSVTKFTNYLVDENESSSSKRVTAIKYGIPIITDLNDLLKEKKNNE
jgi:DNA ligase (NAD+)